MLAGTPNTKYATDSLQGLSKNGIITTSSKNQIGPLSKSSPSLDKGQEILQDHYCNLYNATFTNLSSHYHVKTHTFSVFFLLKFTC